MEDDIQTRQSKVDKNFIRKIFDAIGVEKVPKTAKVHAEMKLMKKSDPYLTLGRNVDAEALLNLEKKWKAAYKVDLKNTLSFGVRQRHRGHFRSLHTYRSRLDTQKLQRLFVPENIKLPGKSITDDIDAEYYTIVGGRPIKDRSTLADHKWAVRTCLLTRLAAGRVADVRTKMKDDHARDMVELEEGEKEVDRQAELFEKFLEENYQMSADLLAQAEAADCKAKESEAMRVALEKEVEAAKSRVAALQEKWEECKKQQQFLYSVAPLQWRRLHDAIHTNKDQSVDPNMLKRIRGSLSLKEDISSKVSKLFDRGETCETEALFFTEPDQLMEVLSDQEERTLSLLALSEKQQPAVLTINKAKEMAEAESKRERLALTEDVEKLRAEVEAEEEEALKLEKEMMEKCQQNLRPLLTNRETVSVMAALEHAYEMVIGPLDGEERPSAVEMMQALTNCYEAVRLELDLMPTDIVNKAMAEWNKENLRVMKEAKQAARKVHEMEMLSKRFMSALKPITRRVTRRPMPRSQPPREKKEKVPPPPGLTKEQIERQYLFCKAQGTSDDIYRPMLQ